MTSSIVETKLPDGRDMLIISGYIYVKISALYQHEPQTGENDDPGLVGITDLPPASGTGPFKFTQDILIGPKWFMLKEIDVVPMVSPVNISSEGLSDAEFPTTGYGIDLFKVLVWKRRIRLSFIVTLFGKPWLPDQGEGGFAGGPSDFLLRVDYCVTAVGTKNRPKMVRIQRCTDNLPIPGIEASSNTRDGFPAGNATDGIPDSRWTADGTAWIRADLGVSKQVCRVDIWWWQDIGETRHYNYTIETSTNGTTFTPKLSGISSGNTSDFEKYTIPTTNARYVRVTVDGSDVNPNAHIRELDIYGLK